MRSLDQLQMHLRMLFFRSRERKRLAAEVQFHLEQQVAENVASGMNPETARQSALCSFGNPILLRDHAAETWSWSWLDSFFRDLRITTRSLLRARGFAITSVLIMAIGIGASIALFTVVHGMLKPLPFPSSDRLVSVYESEIGGDSHEFYSLVSPGMFAEWTDQNHSFKGLALLANADFNVSGSGSQLPERVHGVECTWNLWSILGVQPILGRSFTPSDDQPSANGTVLLSWSLWESRFGGNPAILNQTIQLNQHSYTVIGILPSWFAYPDSTVQLWTPIYHDQAAQAMGNLAAHQFHVVGRLIRGVSIAQGLADLSLISRRVHVQHLDNAFVGESASGRLLLDDMVGTLRRPLYTLLAAAFCVLLIACLNVSNLMVARAASRRKDFAIRIALGCNRLYLLRQRLMESWILSITSGAAGFPLAYGIVYWLAYRRVDLIRTNVLHIDHTVALFTLCIIVMSALFTGMISALSIEDRQLVGVIQDSARGSTVGNRSIKLRMALLAIEVAATSILLATAGLLLKSYMRLSATEIGCVTDNVLTMGFDLSGPRYRDYAQRVNLYTTLLERIKALPGVASVGFGSAIPGQGYVSDEGFAIAEDPPLAQGEAQYALDRWVDPGFFATLGIPVVRGHTFEWDRRLTHANQAVINVSFAHRYFPNENPIGKHLKIGDEKYEIVGIVGDTRYSLAIPPEPIQYLPLFTGFMAKGTVVIRSNQNVGQLALPVQRLIHSLDPDLPVSNVESMKQLLGKSTFTESYNATIIALFAASALMLAVVGLFGVLSYIVTQRTAEIAIRIALGAQRYQVFRAVLSDGLRPATAGAIAGLLVSMAVAQFIRSILYQTEPLDPVVFFGVAVLLLLVTTSACIHPAWRASHIDPMQALRTS